jgi:sigma-B regulation protein RsbU (phosphoserine phosphatase)
MNSSAMPRILLIGDPAPDDARETLQAAGFPVLVASHAGLDPAELRRARLLVVDVNANNLAMAQSLCRRWRIDLGEQYTPILWLCADAVQGLATAGLDSGADACLPRSTAPTALLAQAKALLRVEHMHARALARANDAREINQRLQQAHQQIDGDLEMARRIHRAFLPKDLPAVHQTRFAVCYRPRSRVGGDFYDVMRLDEEHVAVYLADAMGQGLPASSLLSIFVKKALRAKEIVGRSYRLVPPDEVMKNLNGEIGSLDMPEPPFVTMLYMQINCRDGAASFARASHAPPILIPADGSIQTWEADGGLLGVFDAEFPVHHRQLRSGDKVLLVSDGARSLDLATGEESVIGVAERHRTLDIHGFVDAVSRDLLELSRSAQDFTALGVEFR